MQNVLYKNLFFQYISNESVEIRRMRWYTKDNWCIKDSFSYSEMQNLIYEITCIQ